MASWEANVLENGRFEIGEDDADDAEDEDEPMSPLSDWEDIDNDKNLDRNLCFWEDDEEELSQFVCQLYDSLYREGANVNVALQHALASHRSLGYVCHLPTTQ